MWCTVGKESSVRQHLKSGGETNHPLHHFCSLKPCDITNRHVDTHGIFPTVLDLLSEKTDPNGSLCFQDLFQVLPEEDAGDV